MSYYLLKETIQPCAKPAILGNESAQFVAVLTTPEWDGSYSDQASFHFSYFTSSQIPSCRGVIYHKSSACERYFVLLQMRKAPHYRGEAQSQHWFFSFQSPSRRSASKRSGPYCAPTYCPPARPTGSRRTR